MTAALLYISITAPFCIGISARCEFPHIKNARLARPRHTPAAISSKRDQRTKPAFVQEKWNKVKALAAQGKSLDEVKAAMAGLLERNPNMTEVMYTELTAKQE